MVACQRVRRAHSWSAWRVGCPRTKAERKLMLTSSWSSLWPSRSPHAHINLRDVNPACLPSVVIDRPLRTGHRATAHTAATAADPRLFFLLQRRSTAVRAVWAPRAYQLDTCPLQEVPLVLLQAARLLVLVRTRANPPEPHKAAVHLVHVVHAT